MKGLSVITALLVVGALVMASVAPGQQKQQIPTGCAQIVAVLDESGGALSADEIAKRTSTDVETVRNCTDLWRSTMRGPKAPKGANAPQQPVPQGCAQIVKMLDESGGGLSADEIAKKTSTDVETVRNCTDLWRRTMKGGANP